MTKTLLSIGLLLLNAALFLRAEQLMVFPYIPPLTHTPGMGLPLLGTPQPPPFLYLNQLQRLTGPPCLQCPELEEQVHINLEKGKQLRLSMQQQTIELLDMVPQNTMREALLQRDENEARIGEIKVWEQLQPTK